MEKEMNAFDDDVVVTWDNCSFYLKHTSPFLKNPDQIVNLILFIVFSLGTEHVCVCVHVYLWSKRKWTSFNGTRMERGHLHSIGNLICMWTQNVRLRIYVFVRLYFNLNEKESWKKGQKWNVQIRKVKYTTKWPPIN